MVQRISEMPKNVDHKAYRDQICEIEMEACKGYDESKWDKPRFYLNGVEQDQSQISYGYTN